jgi:hypothetical protein
MFSDPDTNPLAPRRPVSKKGKYQAQREITLPRI